MAQQQQQLQQQKPSIVTRVRTFLDEVKAEMAKVAWPSKQEIKDHTGLVLLFLVVIAAVIGVMDFVFRGVIMTLLRLA